MKALKRHGIFMQSLYIQQSIDGRAPIYREGSILFQNLTVKKVNS
jgi:hypothetical protein